MFNAFGSFDATDIQKRQTYNTLFLNRLLKPQYHWSKGANTLITINGETKRSHQKPPQGKPRFDLPSVIALVTQSSLDNPDNYCIAEVYRANYDDTDQSNDQSLLPITLCCSKGGMFPSEGTNPCSKSDSLL